MKYLVARGALYLSAAKVCIRLTTILFLFSAQMGLAQNLVPNPSFENYSAPPCYWISNQIEFGNVIQDWFLPTAGTSDIFSSIIPTNCYASCFSTHGMARGPQSPRTGNFMAGIITAGGNYRESIEVQLVSPMIVGQTYYVEMYVSFMDYSTHASNNIGMYFSETLIYESSTANLNFVPQINETSIIIDSLDWVKISGTFVADNSYEYLVIGNFYDFNETSNFSVAGNLGWGPGYYVDDVLVKETCMSVSANSSICPGESVTLVCNANSFYGWELDSLPGAIVSTDSSYIVSPLNTTTYLAFSDCDSMSVTITVNPLTPVVDLGNDTLFCNGDWEPFGSVNPGNEYLWQDGSTTSIMNPSSHGLYWLEESNGCGTSVDSIYVSFALSPYVNLGDSKRVICDGTSLVLDATYPDAIYLWQDGSTEPTFEVLMEGVYDVQVTNECSSYYDTVIVLTEYCGETLEMPNVITPNNDGVNDFFVPISLDGIVSMEITIVNRWGNIVYRNSNLSINWDGGDVTEGVYTWIINYIMTNEVSGTAHGVVAVIR